MPVVFRSRWWQVWPGCWTLSFIYPDTCANENVLPTGTTGLDVPQKRQPCPASFFPALGIAVSHTHIHHPKVIAKTFFQLKSFQETFREKCNNDPYPGYCKVQPQEEPVLRHPDESTFVFSCSRPFYTLTSSALVEKKVASVNKDKKKGPQIGIDLITAKVAVAREMQ